MTFALLTAFPLTASSLTGSPLVATPSPNQVVQLTGAALILLAYLFLHLGRTGPRKPAYLAANCIGAGLLAFEAARTAQYGFLALEGTWSLISGGVWLHVLLKSSSASTEELP